MSDATKQDGMAWHDGETQRVLRGSFGVPECVPGTKRQLRRLNKEARTPAFKYRRALNGLGRLFGPVRVNRGDGRRSSKPAACAEAGGREQRLGMEGAPPSCASDATAAPWPKSVDLTPACESSAERFDYDWDGSVESLIDVLPAVKNGERSSIVRCDLPVVTTRRGYVALSRALLSGAGASGLGSYCECLLAALLAHAQECAVVPGYHSAGVPLDNVMGLISESCDMTMRDGKDESLRLARLFGELETGQYVTSSGRVLALSLRKVGGLRLDLCRRSDGARGLDDSQSMALSLYHEHQRRKQMLPGYREACTLKRVMAVYLPLTSKRTQGTYYTRREQEVGRVKDKATDLYYDIKEYMSCGAEVDLLEQLQVEALASCINDERVPERQKERLLFKLRAMSEMVEGRLRAGAKGEAENDGPGPAADEPRFDAGYGSSAVLGPNTWDEKRNGGDQ